MRLALCALLLLAAAPLLAPRQPPARRFDFAQDVLPILQRQGCSSAYCHGSATGRGGMKLSLFGSDPAADYAAITAQFGGRRLDLREPAASLLVQKAQGLLDHGGGRRLPRDGDGHRALLDWIAAGAPWRSGRPQELAGLEVERAGDRLAVRATFAAGGGGAGGDGPSVDGDVRDVTALALFASSDPTVVDVDADGVLTARGPGLAHVSARYGNRTALLRVVRPFAGGAAATADAPAHPLDRTWRAHLRELGLQPAPPVDAAQLLRRLSLDLAGRPPTPHELDAFVQRPDAAATAAALTARPEFAVVWGEHLARWFEIPAGGAGDGADHGARRAAFADALRRGETLPAIAARVVDGSLGLVDRLPDPRDRAEYVGRTLLGVRIACARCHDHPLDRWRRAEHLAFSACFAQPRPDGDGGMAAGALFDPDSGEAVVPLLPALGARAATAPGGDRRAAVRAFVLARDHDQLARSLVNRVFAELVGRGLVEPADDHRTSNPPLSAAMLDALVTAFHAHGGSLPELVAFVATSAVYAAGLGDADAKATHLLAARTSLPLRPDAFARAAAAVVGRPAAGTLPASALARELELRNGAMLPAQLAAGGTTVDAIFDTGADPRERLRELWRTVLSRPPRADEEARFLPLAAQDLSAFRDLAYALLTGREFGHRR
jgi:hypothetical protein